MDDPIIHVSPPFRFVHIINIMFRDYSTCQLVLGSRDEPYAGADILDRLTERWGLYDPTFIKVDILHNTNGICK